MMNRKALNKTNLSLMSITLVSFIILIILSLNHNHIFWEHEPIHSAIESIGAFAALFMAYIYIRSSRDVLFSKR